MKTIYESGVKYNIGENARDNWDMLGIADDSYYFFHLSSFPSCYVIMESKYPSQSMLRYGAMLCKHATKYRHVKNIKVDYCRCSNLVKGDNTGEVVYVRPRQVNKIHVF
jgi:predicted ribosome quality control (RQC) complex YloA/Tae2 family protein